MGTTKAVAPVSVIIPCWRCGQTIERAVESVAAQTLLPAEVLLIDDASDDDSVQTLRNLELRYPAGWIRVLQLAQNSGPGIARNFGWESAQQPYLAFLDADDAWHPRKIEMQYGWMCEHPEVVLCGHQSVLATGNSCPPISEIFTAAKINKQQMLISNRFPTRSVMLRRDIQFRFRNQRLAEDYFIWLDIVLSGAPAWFLNVALACAFRPEYSPGGCSGDLRAHEKSEQKVFWTLWREGKLNLLEVCVCSAWAFLKYVRRWIRMSVR